MKNERYVLMIFPHPDNETFSSAGTIASYIENGVPITYVRLTLGQMGRNLSNPPSVTGESLPYIREKRLKNAMKVIGITDLRKIGLRGKAVESEPHERMDDMVKTLIKETSPSVIISFYSKFAVHSDHEATAEAVVRTIGRMPREERPRLQLVTFSNDTPEILGEPDILNGINQYKGTKLKASEAHKSQTDPFLEQLTDPEVGGET